MSFISQMSELSPQQIFLLSEFASKDAACQAADDAAMRQLLTDLAAKPSTVAQRLLCRNASAGIYGDFCSVLTAPKLLLLSHLEEAGYADLHTFAQDGKYDSAIDFATVQRLVLQVKSSITVEEI